ncbi:MAG: hypothetical protein HFF36_04955 [Coprobacillus sp.]|nr:hypothetical protein [Coprobacillus sp.]
MSFFKKYKFQYHLITKHYNTSTGYYTKNQAYERYAIVPQTNDTYIYLLSIENKMNIKKILITLLILFIIDACTNSTKKHIIL